MDLASAATYFSRTPVAGWNGTGWVENITFATLLPHDRFISEREFGLKRRYILVHPDSPIGSVYKVVKIGVNGPIYMLGTLNHDIQEAEYSLVYLVHRAQFTGSLIRLTKASKASGVTASVTRTNLGTFHCDAERVTFERSTEFQGVRLPSMSLILPSGTPVNTDHEWEIGDETYQIDEVFDSAGFVYCRALAKRPTP